jgi:hypothetical protein
MIWVPEHAGELLLVTIDSRHSEDSEWNGMMLVNQGAYDWLAGKIDTGTYFDMLDQIGIDPIRYVGEFENYLFGLTNNLSVSI